MSASNGSTSARPRMPTCWLRPLQSTMPSAQRGSRLRLAGKDVPPMIQKPIPSQWNQTGDSRGPCSELWARCAYRGLDKNSLRSKSGRSPAETLCSTIFIRNPPEPTQDEFVGPAGNDAAVHFPQLFDNVTNPVH